MTVSAAPPPGVSLQTEIDALNALQYRNPRQGLQRGLQLRREALRQGEEALAAWACQHASVCAARLQRYGLAERLNREATERFTVHGDRPGLLSAENLRGILAQERAQFREAYGHFHHVLLGSREAGLNEMYGKALNNLSLAAQGMGDLDAALDWSLQSLTFAEAQGNWETYTLTLINRANLYLEVGHIDAARQAAENGVRAARALQRPATLATTLNNLSVALHRDGRYQAALAAAQESLDLEQALGNGIGVACATTQIGLVQMELGMHQASAQTLLDARRLTEGCPDPALELEVLTLLGTLHVRMGEWRRARDWLAQAERFAQEHQDDAGLQAVLDVRARLEERAGDHALALRTFKRFHVLDRKATERRHNQRTQALLLTHEIREHRRRNEELTAANAHLTHAANHDSLTGSLTRRAFLQACRPRLAERGHHSVVLIDIDHFKGINDTFGHQTGDEVLRQVVQVITGCIREGDLLCRWGGEEFILLLPHTTPAQALGTCERLRDRFRTFAWATGRPVTASFGVSRQASHDLDTLVAEADQALYAAKEAGRDRSCLFPEVRG